MAISIKLDDLLHDRRMTLTELADRIGMTLANLSILKTGKARAIRFSTLNAICGALSCQPGDILRFERTQNASPRPTRRISNKPRRFYRTISALREITRRTEGGVCFGAMKLDYFVDHDIHAGLSGIEIDFKQLDLGNGLLLRQTYAHLMAPFLMAFGRPEPNKPHPAPWKAALGGLGLDITAELVIPRGVDTGSAHRVDAVRMINALIRMWVIPTVVMQGPFEHFVF